jgi:hypothetical protein
VDLPDWYYLALIFVVGFFWLAAYVLAIWRANIDHRNAIPAIAVGLNLAWEFNYSLIVYQAANQRPFNFAWFLLDIFIARQVLRYGRQDYPGTSQRDFRRFFFAIFAFALIFLPAVTLEIDDSYGAYTGLGVNCCMSLAFVMMLRRRKSSAGQSLYIAGSKGIGSLLGVVMSVSLYPHSYIIAVMGATVIILDTYYAVTLYRQIRAEGASPWAINRPPVATGERSGVSEILPERSAAPVSGGMA